jgi:hypothetical protein
MSLLLRGRRLSALSRASMRTGPWPCPGRRRKTRERSCRGSRRGGEVPGRARPGSGISHPDAAQAIGKGTGEGRQDSLWMPTPEAGRWTADGSRYVVEDELAAAGHRRSMSPVAPGTAGGGWPSLEPSLGPPMLPLSHLPPWKAAHSTVPDSSRGGDTDRLSAVRGGGGRKPPRPLSRRFQGLRPSEQGLPTSQAEGDDFGGIARPGALHGSAQPVLLLISRAMSTMRQSAAASTLTALPFVLMAGSPRRCRGGAPVRAPRGRGSVRDGYP